MDVSYFEPAEKFGKLKESFNIWGDKLIHFLAWS